MNSVFEYLDERTQEFERHHDVALMLEGRIDSAIVDDDLHIEVRHVNTVKSGLIVHLYNIVEAVSTRTLEEVGQIVATESPGKWTDDVLTEWVRSEFWAKDERLGENALKHLTQLSGKLVSGDNAPTFTVKGEPGSWNDVAIKKVAKRLACELTISAPIKQKAYEKVYRNETTAMQYLALRRNDIAHGIKTFEEGANDLTLAEVKALAQRVLPYLKEVINSYKRFLDQKHFLKANEAA